MSKIFLFITLLLATLFQGSSSTHLKTKVQKAQSQAQAQYIQKGTCFVELSQRATWRLSTADPQWIYTKHGQCKDLNFVGKGLNDDTDFITFNGDCETCSVQIFDDANFGGGSKIFKQKDCTYNKWTCELGDWDDRISSAKLCCEKDSSIDYRYAPYDPVLRFSHPWCTVRFHQDSWTGFNYLDANPQAGRCDEKSNLGKDFNDNIDHIRIEDECLDCTIQLFDDADFKGDSKTIKIGSDECPITHPGVPKCGLGGWEDRVSSYKVCCPTFVV